MGLYKDGDETKCEADVDIFGASVRMQPEGGTPYGAHPFHNWQSEGSVVSCDGAFVYVRLGDFGETSVYYCHPSDGVYAVNDPNALTTRHYDTLPNVCGFEVTVDNGTGEYRFHHVANNVDKRVNKGVVDEIALTMASCLRDEKYPETLRSYLTGKIRAAETDRSLLELIYGLVSYLSDLHAVKTVPFATCVQGHPVNFGWCDIVKFRIKIFITYFVRVFGDRVRNRVAGSSFARYCAPWMFTDIAVPSYEVYVKNAAAKFGTGLRGRFNREQFPATSTPGIAGGDGRSQHDSGENAGQRVSLNGNQSAERCAETPTTFVPPVESHSCVCDDAHCQGAKSRTQSRSTPVEPRRSERASVTAESEKGRAHVEFEGACGGRGDSVSTYTDTPIRREQGGSAVKSVQSPCLVVSCEEREGLVDSISVQTLLGTAHHWELTRVDKTALRDANISTGDLCITIEEILREIAGRSVNPIDYGAIIIWCVRFLINPHGRYSDKSSVPKGSGLLPIVPGSTVPQGFKTYATGGVVIALSPSEAGSIASSDVEGGCDGVDEKGRDRKMLSKNRNKHKGRRST